ncbi:hypothetical protein HNP84_008982 [Thermocatellispora tengchongensis]|uniref:Uncharacterized protein n=1 Tax=Thermocatellispora tengchongensis TaxID=1073253 RepID=A0A840PJT2_9ACTN|nr:hypothetical protein [Thermocatellispora tengchongensis]MBB5139219.1 hypothetical protein [Thermocatellispora tengchongensis]
MKGDRVEIVVDAGDTTRTYEVVATRAGRRVEVTIGRGVVEVAEVTRSGTPVRTARFMSSRLLALVEHPAPRPPTEDERADEARERARNMSRARMTEHRELPERDGTENDHVAG